MIGISTVHFGLRLLMHADTFGEADNLKVPDYTVTKTANGFVADYISTVSNYSKEFKYLNPPGFVWHRRLEAFLPFTAKLTAFLPNGQLHTGMRHCGRSSKRTRRSSKW
jgi:hypothetical protein